MAAVQFRQYALVFNMGMFHTRGVTSGSGKVRVKRPYDSRRRRAGAAATRAAVYAAASDLFATRGFAATGMRDIARAAGVALETVYAAGNKSELLLRVIDIAVVGDDEPVPLAERPEFRAMGVGPRSDRVAAVARMLTELHGRVAPLNRALAQAAIGDDALASQHEQTHERRRESFRDGLRLVLEAEPSVDLVDGLWAIGSPDVYLSLVEMSGWPASRYESWLADTIARQLP